MMKSTIVFLMMIPVFFGSPQVQADEVRVLDVSVQREVGLFGDSYLFVVTLEHNDEGWDHFADRWEVWTPDGKLLLDTRSLAHPHVDEQPFTRSLSGVEVPEGLNEVLIRAHDLVHGDSPHTFLATLPASK